MATKAPTHRQQRKRFKQHTTRPNAAARGYDARWARLRRWYLTRHPVCERCEAQGRTAAATMVHHMRPVRYWPGLRLAVANLQALCTQCHAATHAGEGGLNH